LNTASSTTFNALPVSVNSALENFTVTKSPSVSLNCTVMGFSRSAGAIRPSSGSNEECVGFLRFGSPSFSAEQAGLSCV
jgi:hypothetical protein